MAAKKKSKNQNDAKRIEYLEELITALDSAYEVGDECINPFTNKIVSDSEYDALRKELADLAPKSKIFNSVTASTVSTTVKKVSHNPPMTSISKANGTIEEKNDILADWLKNCMSELGYKDRGSNSKPRFSQSIKHDGVAIAIYYENGNLVRAGLRPRNGIDGEDVTENVKFVEGVPLKLPLPLTCSIRGELECKVSVFEKLNAEAEQKGEQVFANPRNYTAGSIRQFKDPKETGKRKLSFVGYSIEGLDNPPYKTEIERAKWCNQVLKVPFVRTEPFHYSELKKLEDLVSSLDYEVDGVVLSVNNLEDQEQLGRQGNNPTGNPKGKLAWKFAEQSVVVPIKGLLFQTGRTGKVTPVCIFDGVKLAGTIVRQCTAHNVGIVINKKIGIGAEVRIIKSGKIIPKIIEVVKSAANVTYPTNCPSCCSQLVKEDNADDGTSELYCLNTYGCPAQKIAAFVHFLATLEVKGIAEAAIEKMINANLLNAPADFYRLNTSNLEKAGFSERQSLLILAALRMIDSPEQYDSKDLVNKINQVKFPIKFTLPRILAGLGIPNVGKGTSRVLSDHFNHDFAAIRNCDGDGFLAVNEIGDITAVSLADYFEKNRDNIDDLFKFIDIEKPKVGKFTGKTFVFTGGFAEGKKHWQSEVEKHGGKIGSSVSKGTDYVVVGEDAGSKADKAKQLNIPMISSSDLKKMID